MSANTQGASSHWRTLNTLAIDTQSFWLLKAHFRPDAIGSLLGVCGLSTSATDARSNDLVQLQLSTGGFPMFRKSNVTTTRTMTTGSAFVANTWKMIGAAWPAFDGTAQTIRVWNGTASEDFTGVTLGAYTGNFVSMCVGDGSFASADGRIAYVALYNVASLAAASTLMTQLDTTQPSAVGSPTLDLPFVSVAPGGWSAFDAGATIDAAENPTLSGGGGGPTASSPIVINVG